MKKIFFLIFMTIFSNVRADWSESYGGDGVVAGFTMIARSMVKEMEQSPTFFEKKFIEEFKKSIDETRLSSADVLFLDGVEKDAINHTLEKPFRIEISRNRWLQYELSIDTQEKLVLHEYLFTMHINDSDYITSGIIYRTLIALRMSQKNEDTRLGPFLLEAASDCRIARVSNLVSLGVNLNYTDDENRNSLFMAAASGCVEITLKLLDIDIPALKSNKNLWSPGFAAFVGALKNENDPERFKKYKDVLIYMNKYYLDIDGNKDALFNSDEFPAQLNACSGQTMFMRSLIGINFYIDEKHTKIMNVRNLKIARLFKRLGASLVIKDSCGMTAVDYAKLYNINLDEL